MSTPSKSEDLDRTDELPVLDVVAYEAAHVQEADPLATTDTWLVEAIETDTMVRTDTADFPAPARLDLSIDVEKLRQRIVTLEDELLDARQSVRESEAAVRIPIAERNELKSRIAALESENAHLREQHQMGERLTQRLQGQLRELVESNEEQLERLERRRETDRQSAEQQRLMLEQQLERSTANFTSTADEHARLRRALEESRDLASSRARQIDELQRSLTTEHGKAHVLGRNLAAKLADYDILSSMVSQRNATIASLEREREELNQQLQRSFADAHRLNVLLEEASQRATASDSHAQQVAQRDARIQALEKELAALKQEHEAAIASRQALELGLQQTTTQTASLQEQQSALGGQLEASNAARAELESRLQSLLGQHAQLQQQHDSRERELAERSSALQAMSDERDGLVQARADAEQRARQLDTLLQELTAQSSAQQDRLRQLEGQLDQQRTALDATTQERDRLLQARSELEQRVAELEGLGAQLVQTTQDLQAARAELETRTGLAASREQALESAHQAIEELQHTRDELRTQIERLQAVSKDDSEMLHQRLAELAQLRTQLQEQQATTQGFEVALRARDTLIENLRTELLTAQDERGIMSDQVGKARARIQALNQQLFSRDNRIATLKADLAVHVEALAAIRQDVDGMATGAHAASAAVPDRFLEPVGHEGIPIALNRRVMTVGRTDDNDICIPSKMISRHHARLLIGPNAVIVEDAGSTNGCFVNDQQVKQHVLHDGDVLSMGDLKFRLRVGAHAQTIARDSGAPLLKARRRDD